MSTTVTYKGSTLTTVNNQTRTLKTAGKYMEGDVILTDVTSSGEASKKQINFIDYDGTVLHSYTKSEWQSVSALPSNPSHTGLTAQGWNWTKAQIDAQLVTCPDGDIWVGQMYITDDGKTRIYIHLEEGRLHPYLGIGVDGTVVVDWGDNSATSTLTGTSLTTAYHADHIYSSGGDYMITLTVSSGSFAFFGVSNTSHILKKDDSTTSYVNEVYTNAVQKIEIGSNADIGSYAFHYCGSLTSITIPSDVTSIGNDAFSYCYSLTSITIPSNVTSISAYAFCNCGSLTSITIPSDVTSISTYVFYSCYSLTSITIPSNVTSIGAYAFNYCYSLTSITIPSDVTSIGTGAFNYCRSLTSITILSNVTSIDNNVFNSCYLLTSIMIPNNVTSIGTGAFNYCRSLTSITIPSSVTSIGNNAFSSCYGIAEYHFLSTIPPTLANTNAFYNIQSDCIIYVPSASLETYKTTNKWSTYASYMQGE